jgi:tetratricopeptide (TPR) repeat protein
MGRRLGLAVIACFYLGAALSALAQEQSISDPRYRSAFEAMMADPTNAERSFEFAEAAVAAGDLRGAIAALERILRLNPGLANIELELGVLYLRVGQNDLAATYLRRAIVAPNVPEAVRDRAQALLARAERGRRRHFFSGYVYGGARYDSNANLGPSSSLVRVLGNDALLDPQFTGQSDWSAELTGALNYIYALETQQPSEIEANLTTYNRRYDETSQFDLSSFGIDVGPRLYPRFVADGSLSIRPFISASYLTLDGDEYLQQWGGGVNVRKFFEEVSFFDLTLLASDQDYEDSPTRPVNSLRSGTFVEAIARVSHQVLPRTRVFALVGLAQRDSDAAFETFREAAGWVGVTQVYPAPFGLTPYPWGSTLSLGFRRTTYDEPDPTIDPDEKREDDRFDVILTNNIQMSRSLTLVVTLQYSDNNSSLPNFEYDNTAVSAGIQWNF